MARTAGVLAALALMPAAAAAQNGYSFLDADKSAVHYSVATAKPVMGCEGVAQLSWASMTVLSARVVPAADGVPEHCRVSGLIEPEVRFELNLPANWNRRFYMHGNGGFAGEAPESAAGGSRRGAEAGLRHGADQHRSRRDGRAAGDVRR